MIGLFGEDLRAHCMLYLVEAHVDVLAHEQRHSVILGCTLRDLRRLGAKQLENEVSRFHQSCASSCELCAACWDSSVDMYVGDVSRAYGAPVRVARRGLIVRTS